MIAVIPFSGFYNSWHSEALDSVANQCIQDSNGNVRDGLAAHFDASYTSAMLEGYCRLYTKAWADATGIACTFESLHSPREYNFTTDRIFVDILESTVRRLLLTVDRATLDKVAADRHTSCDGFISYYSPDVSEWGDVAEWGPEQLHTLLIASQPDDMPEEYELVDDCNGAVSNLVYDALSEDDLRIVRIADYLREREERKYRKGGYTKPFGVLSIPASYARMAELNGQLTLTLE